ncbi:MAG: RNA-binding protein [Bacteroidetes bacterium]|nr:RNA-binding protein [Bacteroidota bacterium]
MNIYVGNLTPEVSDSDLEEAFTPFGKVKEAKVVRDMFTQESKGFGFVEMFSQNEGNAAIEQLNVTELKGKVIIVNKARPERKKGGRGRR